MTNTMTNQKRIVHYVHPNDSLEFDDDGSCVDLHVFGLNQTIIDNLENNEMYNRFNEILFYVSKEYDVLYLKLQLSKFANQVVICSKSDMDIVIFPNRRKLKRLEFQRSSIQYSMLNYPNCFEDVYLDMSTAYIHNNKTDIIILQYLKINCNFKIKIRTTELGKCPIALLNNLKCEIVIDRFIDLNLEKYRGLDIHSVCVNTNAFMCYYFNMSVSFAEKCEKLMNMLKLAGVNEIDMHCNYSNDDISPVLREIGLSVRCMKFESFDDIPGYYIWIQQMNPKMIEIERTHLDSMQSFQCLNFLKNNCNCKVLFHEINMNESLPIDCDNPDIKLAIEYLNDQHIDLFYSHLCNLPMELNLKYAKTMAVIQ